MRPFESRMLFLTAGWISALLFQKRRKNDHCAARLTKSDDVRVDSPDREKATDYGFCSWCGSALRSAKPMFCAECKGPLTRPAKWMYTGSFLLKSLAIPAAIGAFSITLAERQQDSSQLIASRQKLADSLIVFDKNTGDMHQATRHILLLSISKDTNIPSQMLRDAVLKIDLGMKLFGGNLIPFEEFARRMHTYGPISEHQPSPLQSVWDHCFVAPYWIDAVDHPSFFSRIAMIMAECDNTNCPTSAAARIFAITEELYQGHCRDGLPVDFAGKAVTMKNFVWFDHQLRSIIVHSESTNIDPYNGEDI